MNNQEERFSEYYVDYEFVTDFLERQFNTEIDDYLEGYKGQRDEDYLPEIGCVIESFDARKTLRQRKLSPTLFMTQAPKFLQFLREHWRRLVWDCSTDKTAPETWIQAAVQDWAGEYRTAVLVAICDFVDEEADLLLSSLFCAQAVYSVMLTDEGWTDGFAEQPHYFARAWSVGIEPCQLLPSGSGHSDILITAAHQAAWHVIHCVIQCGLQQFLNGPGRLLHFAAPPQQLIL